MSRGLLLFMTGLVCGCAPVVGVVRTATPLPPPTAPHAVELYLSEGDAPEHYDELGLVIANTHVFVPVMISLDAHLALAAQRLPSGNQLRGPVFDALLRQAARLGADGVILTGFEKAGAHLTVCAVAIRRR